MDWLIDRMKEGTTHNGVGLLLLASAAFFPQYADVLVALAAAFGVSGVVKKEGQQ